jgi:hypothetical protein
VFEAFEVFQTVLKRFKAFVNHFQVFSSVLKRFKVFLSALKRF